MPLPGNGSQATPLEAHRSAKERSWGGSDDSSRKTPSTSPHGRSAKSKRDDMLVSSKAVCPLSSPFLAPLTTATRLLAGEPSLPFCAPDWA